MKRVAPTHPAELLRLMLVSSSVCHSLSLPHFSVHLHSAERKTKERETEREKLERETEREREERENLAAHMPFMYSAPNGSLPFYQLHPLVTSFLFLPLLQTSQFFLLTFHSIFNSESSLPLLGNFLF